MGNVTECVEYCLFFTAWPLFGVKTPHFVMKAIADLHLHLHLNIRSTFHILTNGVILGILVIIPKTHAKMASNLTKESTLTTLMLDTFVWVS